MGTTGREFIPYVGELMLKGWKHLLKKTVAAVVNAGKCT